MHERESEFTNPDSDLDLAFDVDDELGSLSHVPLDDEIVILGIGAYCPRLGPGCKSGRLATDAEWVG